MRMVVIGPRPPLRGGIAAHTVALEKLLQDRGHDVVRIGFSRLYPPGLFPGRSEHEPGAALSTAIDEVRVDTLNPKSWSVAERAIAAARCDRVVFEWWHPFFSRVIRRLTASVGAPVVAVCHNARPHEVYPGWRRATVRALGAADLIVCHSHAVSNELGRVLPWLPRRVVPMPVLLPRVAEIDKTQARSRLGLREHGRLALFAGHARRYKGTEILLAAWDRAQLPSMAGLVLAGESYLGQGRLEAAAARCRRTASIRVIDRYLDDDELAAWLVAADVLVLSYLRASQSGLLGSAVAAGTQIIASNTGGLAEQARATNAVLVEPGVVDQLAQALSTTLGRVPRDHAGDATQHARALAVARAGEELAIACELAGRRE